MVQARGSGCAGHGSGKNEVLASAEGCGGRKNRSGEAGPRARPGEGPSHFKASLDYIVSSKSARAT